VNALVEIDGSNGSPRDVTGVFLEVIGAHRARDGADDEPGAGQGVGRQWLHPGPIDGDLDGAGGREASARRGLAAVVGGKTVAGPASSQSRRRVGSTGKMR
jgi:hypothetical protein